MGARVEFHTGVAEPIGYCCRLLRKAYRHGATVVCVAERATLELLDRQLWMFEERDFLPHVRHATASAAMRVRTPIWLAERLPEDCGTRDVAVGLGSREPMLHPRLARLIEVVAQGEEDALRGRELWRLYQQAGCELVHHAQGGQMPS